MFLTNLWSCLKARSPGFRAKSVSGLTWCSVKWLPPPLDYEAEVLPHHPQTSLPRGHMAQGTLVPCSLRSVKSYPTKMMAWTPPPQPRALPPESASHFSTCFRANIVSPEKDRRQWDTGLRLPRSPGGPCLVGPGRGPRPRGRLGSPGGRSRWGGGGLRHWVATLHRAQLVWARGREETGACLQNN